jgi:hypothetical protein
VLHRLLQQIACGTHNVCKMSKQSIIHSSCYLVTLPATPSFRSVLVDVSLPVSIIICGLFTGLLTFKHFIFRVLHDLVYAKVEERQPAPTSVFDVK